MSTLKVLTYPHKILKSASLPITTFDAAFKATIDEMFSYVYQNNGVGLAANQVGLLGRFFVMDASSEQNDPMCLVNPEIIEKMGEKLSQEGCFSLPGLYVPVTRAEKVVVKYQDVTGLEHTRELEGLAAICCQHELDHLDGILAIDHLSKLKRTLAIKKMEKYQKLSA